MKTVRFCPVCGAEMLQTRRGATLKKRGPSYVCPVNVDDILVDEDGRRTLRPGALHTGIRQYTEEELLNPDANNP